MHYAGFFDPGFGHASGGGEGARAVLEVRSHEVPFILEDGQIIGRLIYERLATQPEQVYGQGIGSNYQRQGLKAFEALQGLRPRFALGGRAPLAAALPPCLVFPSRTVR